MTLSLEGVATLEMRSLLILLYLISFSPHGADMVSAHLGDTRSQALGDTAGSGTVLALRSSGSHSCLLQ